MTVMSASENEFGANASNKANIVQYMANQVSNKLDHFKGIKYVFCT
jgi:hypothetical protein